MSVLKNERLSRLLKKFRANVITSAEFQDLKESIGNSSDSELKEILLLEWDDFKDYLSLPENKIDQLYGRMNIKEEVRQKHFMLRGYWTQIAASILFIVTMGLTVLLYMQNKTISTLAEKDVVVCSGDYGKSLVTLPDGTLVHLNAKSSLTYSQDFGRSNRNVKLSGEGFFEVKKSSEKKFVVSTGYVSVTVLGTKFNVYAYENKDVVEMSLVEGSVNIVTEQPPYKSINVKPNEKITYMKSTGELKHEVTSNKMETAWLQKELVFRSERLENVFNSLSRKFAVTFNVEEQSLMNDLYTGTFDDENIESIMKVLKMHYNFDYNMNENNEITIYSGK